ncbi:ring finger domain protein [Colletotrichum incanum]|uniref:Ring finger domain protein n=1 Tax=Colletotrichum incanum TaxID=1573173 RepID=A0A162Q7F8_COLIC|nr:ring finger domain protein [Colletotrichum incanum]
MDTLPVEIITYIASFMKVGDLSNFRLANRHLANVTFRLLAKHLCVLNVVEDLRDLVAFVSAKSNTYHTEAVTLLHGRWPVCDFDEWVAHPLQFNEFLPQTPSTTRRRQDAFMKYRTFAENEAHRDTNNDVAELRALSFLPKLRHLTISHIHTKGWRPVGPKKYLALRKRIWMAPYINDSIGDTAQSLLRLLPSLSSVRKLSIEGRLDPSFISIAAPIIQITTLELKAVQLYDIEGQSFLSFLHAFPSLKDLSLGFISTEFMAPVDKIHLKSLRKLHLHPTSIDISVEDEKSRLLARFLGEQSSLSLTCNMTQNPARCFRTRRDGLIFKAHTLQSFVPDAQVAVFTLFEGRLYSYQSHDSWPVNPFELKGIMVLPDDQKLPDHFNTVTGSSSSGSSTNTKPETPGDVIPILDLGDLRPYPAHDRSNTASSGLATMTRSRAATPITSSSVERLPTSSPSLPMAKGAQPSFVARGYQTSSTTLSGGVRKSTCTKNRQDLPPIHTIDTTMWWIKVKANAPGLPGVLLEENTHIYNLAQDVPEILMVVGASQKQLFLSKAYPKTSRLDADGHFNFFECDQSTAVLDCNLLAELPKAQGGPLPGHVIRHCLESVRQTPTAILQAISARLFYPFASTLVFFADDFGGPENAADVLANWVTTSQQATIPPHLFVITESTVPSKAFIAMVKSKMMCFTHRKAPESPSSPTEAERMLMRHFANVTLISPSNYKYRPQIKQKHRLNGLHLGRLFNLAIHQLLQNEPFDLLRAWRTLYPSPIQAGRLLSQICTEAMDRGIDPLGIASSSLASDPLVHHLPADHVFTSYEKQMVDVEVLCRKNNLPDQFRREFCERANETMPTTRPWEAAVVRVLILSGSTETTDTLLEGMRSRLFGPLQDYFDLIISISSNSATLSTVVGLPTMETFPARETIGATRPTKRTRIRRRLRVKGGISLRPANQHQCCVAYMNDSSKCHGNYVTVLEGCVYSIPSQRGTLMKPSLEELADVECTKAWPSAQSFKVVKSRTNSELQSWIGPLLASCFYAEPCPLSARQGFSECFGILIRCRIPPSTHFHNMMMRFRQWRTPIFFRVGKDSWSRTLLCDETTWELLKDGHEFEKRLDVNLPWFGPTAQIQIETTPAGGGCCDISNSPCTISDLLQAQDFFNAAAGLGYENGKTPNRPKKQSVRIAETKPQGALDEEMKKLGIILEDILAT